jgi:hypothetical protein
MIDRPDRDFDQPVVYNIWESMRIFRYKAVRRWILFWKPRRIVVYVLERRLTRRSDPTIRYTVRNYRWREIKISDLITPQMLLYPLDEHMSWASTIFQEEIKRDAFDHPKLGINR